MRNRVRRVAIALGNTFAGVNKSPISSVLQANKRLLSVNNRRRAASAAVCSLFAFATLAPPAIAANPRTTELLAIDSPADKDLFKQILNGVTGPISQTLFAKQFQEFASANAPVTISTRKLYKTVGSLPGNTPFRPVMLDAVKMSPDTQLPAGDYLVPVRVYCMQHSGSSPNGHRYVLSKLSGKRKDIIADFHHAAASARYKHNEIQGISWWIQAGRRYSDMPSDMKLIVDQMIPQHRQKLDQIDFINQIQGIWNTSATLLNLPSLQSFLQQQGNLGQTVLTILALRQGTIQSGSDWRNLGRTFVLPDNGTGNQDIGNTPWSQVQDGVYARFVTPKNYQGVGLWQFRILRGAKAIPSTSSKPQQGRQETVQQRGSANEPSISPTEPASAFRSLNIWNPDGSLTVPGLHSKQVKGQKKPASVLNDVLRLADLLGILRTSVAVPEGKDNNQPLMAEPTSLDDWWQDWRDLWRQLGDSLPAVPNDVRNALNKAAVATSLTGACAALATAGVPVVIEGSVATGGYGLLVAVPLYAACGFIGVKTAQSLPTLNNESTEQRGENNRPNRGQMKPPPKGGPGIRGTRRVQSPNQRQRWKGDDGKIYEWDRQEGEWEVFDRTGKRHLGVVREGKFDPTRARPGRTTNN